MKHNRGESAPVNKINLTNSSGILSIALMAIGIFASAASMMPIMSSVPSLSSYNFAWILGAIIIISMSYTMGKIAAAFPTPGGPYSWTTQLTNVAGLRLGWLVGCYNIIGIAGLTMNITQETVGMLVRLLGGFAAGTMNLGGHGSWARACLNLLVIFSQALFCVIDSRRMVFFIKVATLAMFAAFLVVLLAIVLPNYDSYCLRFMAIGSNNIILGQSSSFPPSTLLGVFGAAVALVGSSASVHFAADFKDQVHCIARAMVLSVLASALLGWFLSIVLIIASSDLNFARLDGVDSLVTVIDTTVPPWASLMIKIVLFFTQYACGLVFFAALIRVIRAFGKDHGLSTLLEAQYDAKKRFNGLIVLSVACLIISLGAGMPQFNAAAGSVAFLSLLFSSLVPIALGLITIGKTWPYPLGLKTVMLFRVTALISLMGGALMIWCSLTLMSDHLAIYFGIVNLFTIAIWMFFGRNRFMRPSQIV